MVSLRRECWTSNFLPGRRPGSPIIMTSLFILKRFLWPRRNFSSCPDSLDFTCASLFHWRRRRCQSTHFYGRHAGEWNMPKMRLLHEATRVPWVFLRTLTTRNTGDPLQNVHVFQEPADESKYGWYKLRSWAFSVNQFGCLSINTSCSVRVSPINPHDHPAADRAFVHLLQCNEKTKMLDKDGYHVPVNVASVCDVQFKNDVVMVSGNARDEQPDAKVGFEHGDCTRLLWLVEIPMFYDVDAVVTEDGSVTVEELENQRCTVQTYNGNIVTRKLKSDRLMLKSVSGDINIMKMLQGNISIETQKLGNVMADRLQGQNVCVNTDSGAMLIKDVYARNSAFHSVGGNLNLGNLHGDVTICCKDGHLKIGSLDGSLRADVEKGNVSAYLSQLKDVEIMCKQGDIFIMTSADIQTRLNLQASGEIVIPEELTKKFLPNSRYRENNGGGAEAKGCLSGGRESSLSACTQKGNITMSIQSWFDSLQLHK